MSVTESALARLIPERLLNAVSLVRSGLVYDLGVPLDEGIPQGNPGAFTPFSFTWRVTPEDTGTSDGYQYAAETIVGCPHISTHIDALVHCQAEDRVFGGMTVAEARGDRGFRVHGAETIQPIIGRAVLFDIASLHEVDALDDGHEVTVAELEQVADRSGIEVRDGDVVLVRTGKIREFFHDPAAFQAGQPGVGVEASIWLYERGMAALGTDTTGTEPLPFSDPRNTTHRAMLVERGVHLIENLDLTDPCLEGVTEGLFICLPLKLTGATGSWVRPVLVV
ncbi:MAG TPA: cyclase family protein [Solirubrobacteraceae bacterium]|jgi:kynurenine formamidase|nr:cyclase family protein [Solirubrobacteraceae bacterium]